MEKKALLIIAPQDFRDEELFETQKVLEAAGIRTEVVSQKKGEIKGMLGGKVRVTKEITETAVADYQAVVFVGGRGAAVYFDDLLAHDLAREAYDQGKVVAAICIAPSILANAGLLKGKKATAYPSEKDNLIAKGAVWTEAPVVVDGKIVTASGPEAARDFGWQIVAQISGQNQKG